MKLSKQNYTVFSYTYYIAVYISTGHGLLRYTVYILCQLFLHNKVQSYYEIIMKDI